MRSCKTLQNSGRASGDAVRSSSKRVQERASPEESPRHSPSPIRHLQENPFAGNHVLYVEQFTKPMVERVLHLARKFRDGVQAKQSLKRVLEVSSTRTSSGF